jgi:hypothetical protein
VKPNVFEPEEYQQYLAEGRFQTAFRNKANRVPMFIWWVFRDYHLVFQYKRVNTKGLVTLGNGKKDVFHLFRSFLRPDTPIVHIASKKYFVRAGKADNGIKVYSNRPELSLNVNGQDWGKKKNGEYRQGPHRVDNVFLWTQPLHTGANVITVSDGAGKTDSAFIVFAGQGGQPAIAQTDAWVQNLRCSNPENPCHFIDQAIESQWPFYAADASNTFDELPKVLEGARWIATRPMNNPKHQTEMTFQIHKSTSAAEVFVVATDTGAAPGFLVQAGFSDTGVKGVWRTDDLKTAPFRVYRKATRGGDTVRLGPATRDFVVLVKSSSSG